MATYNFDGCSVGFSIDSIRRRYSRKDDFFADIAGANPGVNKTKLKKVLEKVWSEAFPQWEEFDIEGGAE
jgi:hypothetical protein